MKKFIAIHRNMYSTSGLSLSREHKLEHQHYDWGLSNAVVLDLHALVSLQTNRHNVVFLTTAFENAARGIVVAQIRPPSAYDAHLVVAVCRGSSKVLQTDFHKFVAV